MAISTIKSNLNTSLKSEDLIYNHISLKKYESLSSLYENEYFHHKTEQQCIFSCPICSEVIRIPMSLLLNSPMKNGGLQSISINHDEHSFVIWLDVNGKVRSTLVIDYEVKKK